MCRMALVIGKGVGLNDFELAFKSSWADHNDDGVGIYWRDFNLPAKKEGDRHLARFKYSRELPRVGDEYDRMLIHFRKSTKGEGTHPFNCRCRPDLGSESWLMTHNGAVQDEYGRKILLNRKEGKHEFATYIDSEVMTHAWGEAEGKTLEEKITNFVGILHELQVTGWANLLFYNVITDEWVAMSDGSLYIVQSKDKNILVVCSDKAWLDEGQADKQKIQSKELRAGDVAYGKGLEYKTKSDCWKRPEVEVTRQADSCSTNKSQKNLYESKIEEVDKITRATESFDYFWKRGYDPKEADTYAKDSPAHPKNHPWNPSDVADDNAYLLCSVCWLPKPYHDLDHEDLAEDDLKKQNKSTITESKWNDRHPFTRDPKSDKIQCMCGISYSFGLVHMPHEFVGLGKIKSYCSVCGNQRTIGNHKEEKPETHMFAALFSKRDGRWAPTEICVRCGFRDVAHPDYRASAPTTAITPVASGKDKLIKVAKDSDGKVWEYIQPTDCQCRLKHEDEKGKPSPILCDYHRYDRGFDFYEIQPDGVVFLCREVDVSRLNSLNNPSK